MNWLKKPITRIISINLIGIFLFSQVSWVYRLDFASFLPILSYQRIESAPASSGFKELSKKIANFLIPSAYAADEDDLLNKYLQEGGVRIDVIPGALNPEFDRTDWLKGNGLISEGEVSEDGAEDYQVAEEGDSGSGEADEGENASFIKEFIAALKEALINIFGDKVEITVENIDKNVDGSSGYDADTDADTVTVLITDLDKGNIIVVTIKIIAGAEEADDNENDGLFILGDGEGNPNEGVQTPEGGSETPLVTQVNVAVLKALQQIDKTGIDADTLRQVFLEAYNQFMAQQGEASSSPDNEGIDPLINPDGLGDDSGLGVTDFKQLLEDNIEQFIDIFTNVLNDTLGANNIVIVNLGGEDPSALFGQDGQGSPEGAGPAGEGLILTVTGDGKYIFFGDDPTSKQILELVSNLMNNDGKLPKDGLMEVLEGLEFPAIEFEGQDQNQDNNNGFTDYDTGDTVFVIYVDNMMDLYGEDKTPVPEGAELNNHAPPRIKLTFDGLTIIIIFNQSSQTTTPNGDETTPTGLNYPGAGLAKANNNADIEVTDQDNSNLGHNNGPPEIPQEVAAYNNPVLNDLWLLYQQANPDATPDEFLSKVSEFLNNNGQF
ncbi:MAG: hypothetical protein JW734_02145, partial [Candidatus Omnitrophica bacterium]|nr:hypothetical protein [Candidatus Omnitrophota bacterium]